MRIIISIICFFSASLIVSCNEPKNDKPMQAEKINIENKGVRIDYTDSGKGDTVLLFVHGWCINKTYWADQEKFFKDRFRIITVDLPGFGASGKNRNDWSVEAFAADIDTVMMKLDLKNVILVGHSMAGDIVLEAAVNASSRVIGLVGVDNFKSVGQKMDAATRTAIKNAMIEMRKNFKALVGAYFEQSLFSKSTDTLVKQRVLNDVFHSDSLIAVACIEPNNFDEAAKLVVYKKKLYLINADIPATDTTGFIANKIPYEIFYTMGTGHYSMIETAGKFNECLGKILGEIGK